MEFDREIYRTVDFILNRASTADLEVLKAAMERRERDSHSRVSAANIRGMAQNLAGNVSRQLEGIGDIKETTKQYIRDMVRKTVPDLPEEQLDLMLEEWVPSRGRQVSEENLPADLARSMIVQFVDYSLGRMSPATKVDLPGGWSRRYWAVFSERTRGLLRELLMGGISEKDFWAAVDQQDG